MTKLGSFGAAMREWDPGTDRDTFEFFGREFTVTGVVPPMLTLQLGAAMTGKISDIEGNAAMWEALRCALTDGAGDDSQFDQLYRVAVRHKCTTDELIKLVFTLVGAQVDLPTGQLPDSADGQLPTSPTSNSSASDTPDSPGFVPVDQLVNG